MNYENLKQEWLTIESKEFKGWDFSYLKGRVENEPLPWNYAELVQQYLKPTDQLLDLGTGGGEFLFSLGHPHHLTSVTESYPPNVELCRNVLAPLGIEVQQIFDDGLIPYEDHCFELVLCRHESYDPKEVKRVLKPGGIFITQQVGCRNNRSLSVALIDGFKPTFPDVALEQYRGDLENNGFEILYANEYYPKHRFQDIGAVIYFAKVIEWEFPGFSVEHNFDHLCSLYEDLQQKGVIETTEHRFILVSRS